ncbi:hypothetical protein QE152_g38086 [Popillia japonica]|uniref:Uncharacterized protein n=1 Tax=Popillia japonica TaxID=7064 RepID=A0AAW1I8J3_POPJA
MKEKQPEPKYLPKSYAEVAGNDVIIKPKTKQDTKTTRDDLTKKLNPAELEIGITRVRSIKEGGLIITCKTNEDTSKIRKEVSKKLKNYSVTTREPKNPCVKIMDIDEELDEEKLKLNLVKQNDTVRSESDICVKTIKKLKKTYMAIVECDPVTFNRIMENSQLAVGWSVCRVFEDVGVFRGGFNHKATDCNTKMMCSTCKSPEHDTEQCESIAKTCQNCIFANKKLSLDLDVNHFIFDSNCPTLKG